MQLNNSECIFPHRCVLSEYLKLNLQQNRQISFGDKPQTTERHSPHYTFTVFATYKFKVNTLVTHQVTTLTRYCV